MTVEKPKKRKMDDLYPAIIRTLHKMVVQVTEIYDLCFGDVIAHIESEEHGC